jgi:hypothetical protein
VEIALTPRLQAFKANILSNVAPPVGLASGIDSQPGVELKGVVAGAGVVLGEGIASGLGVDSGAGAASGAGVTGIGVDSGLGVDSGAGAASGAGVTGIGVDSGAGAGSGGVGVWANAPVATDAIPKNTRAVLTKRVFIPNVTNFTYTKDYYWTQPW